MADDKLIRLHNLKRILADKGIPLDKPGRLGKLIDRKSNQCSDLISGRASFGENIARHIEGCFGLPRGWLDDDHDPSEPIPYGSAKVIVSEHQDTGAIDAIASQIEAHASAGSDLSPMAIMLATRFDRIQGPDAQVDAFAVLITEINRFLERQGRS